LFEGQLIGEENRKTVNFNQRIKYLLGNGMEKTFGVRKRRIFFA
jgi:hypothetical protein